MPRIHVCSLARLHDTVAAARASHLVTLINDRTLVERPVSIGADRHLLIGIGDVIAPTAGMTLPAAKHVEQLIAFAEQWDRASPMVIHCFAGISRSTAAAFITLCHLRPERSERDIARAIRQLSPSASPNPLLVELADALLGRGGRMREALVEIGPGRMAYEGEPFVVPIDDRDS